MRISNGRLTLPFLLTCFSFAACESGVSHSPLPEDDATTGGAGGTTSNGGSSNGGSSNGGSLADSGGGRPSGGAQDSGGSTSGGTTASSGGATADYGQKYPFPQNVTYPYGLSSTKITSDRVSAWYNQWTAKYLQECNGNLRPGTDPLTTSLVEAQGFAMIAAAYMGDKPTLDALYAYYQMKLTSQGCGLMGWKNNCSGFEDQGAATDGDIDVASGLIVAHWQWPNDGYDDKARAILSILKTMISDCSGTSILHPGCSGGNRWGGCDETDISYYSPAFFRYFAEISGDAAWAKLADDSHVLRDRAAHASTGLVPDWQSASGTAGAGSRKGYFSFDAIRTPFKHGLDFLWSGNASAEAWCQKISSWAHGQGVQNIKDEYQLDGTGPGQNHNLAVVGSLTVCAMANSQTILDDFVTESVKLKPDFWYSTYLGNLYLLAMSGNMWNPDIVGQ